jgi:phage N-6-adenine-methyltransferase
VPVPGVGAAYLARSRVHPLVSEEEAEAVTTRHDIAVQHSSQRSDWRTPSDLFAALDREFHFQLDVAADDDNALCEEYLTKAEDGLTAWWRWVTAGACFMNPPYSRGDKAQGIPAEPIEPWIEKAWTESLAGATVVGVLPFSPQTAWFRAYVYGHSSDPARLQPFGAWCGHAARELRLLPHRVTFLRPDGQPAVSATGAATTAGNNTCIVIWTPNPGYVGPWQPAIRYWSYRAPASARR